MEQTAKLKGMGACREALDWLETQPNGDTAWQKCERGDWMLWLLGRLSGWSYSVKRNKLTIVACACARLALPYVPEDEVRPLEAIETAEAWAQGQADITLFDVRVAANAAYDAASAYAVRAAGTRAAASEASYKSTLAMCADIVRTYYPDAPMGDRSDAG